MKAADPSLSRGPLLWNILDSLGAHVAVVDSSGAIILVNRAWEQFALDRGIANPAVVGVGTNYLSVCESARGAHAREGPVVATALRQVLGGAREYFHLEYPCPERDRSAWFLLEITPVDLGDGNRGAVLTHTDITERKKSEQAIQENTSFLETVLDSIQEGLLILDADYRVLKVNTTLRSWFGLSEDTYGCKCYRIFYGLEEKCEICPSREVQETGSYRVATKQAVLADGRAVWLEIHSFPLHDSQGVLTGFVEFVRDVTERKGTEESLQEYQRAVEGSDELVAVVDRNHRYTMANQAYLEKRALHRGQVVGRSVPEVLGKDVYEKTIRKPLEQCFAGNCVEFEMQQPYPQQGTRDVRVRYYPVFGDSGLVERVVGVVKDITEEKRAEEALRESHELYSNLFENSSSVMLLIDPDSGSIVDANRAALDYYGYSMDELKRLKIKEINVLSQEEIHKEMENARREQRTQFHFRHRTSSGEIRHVEVFSGPLHIRGKELLYSIIHDETERVLALRELRETQELLEERVADRTQELEEANRAKSEFLANMSHEIRTPIAGILGLVEMSMNKDISKEMRSTLSLIKETTGSLLNVINDLLDLSKIEARKLEVVPRSFNLARRMRNIIDRYSHQAEDKGLKLQYEFPANVPKMLTADPDRLEQIVTNLLSNAIKFTDQGQVRVKVRKTRESGPLVELKIIVSDSGIGIPEDKQKLLFRNFSQLDPSYSKRHKGTGLGLAISKRLAEMMNGSIDMHSVPGKGSTFTLSVWFEKAKRGATRKKMRKETRDLASLPRLNILLAEDNPVNQLFLSRFLTQAGHNVATVQNGREVLKELSGNQFDLVLMDVQMPEMSGLEATHRIRSSDDSRINPEIPIIALTAYAMKGDREKFIQQGMDGYVAKPVDFERLAETISRILQKS